MEHDETETRTSSHRGAPREAEGPAREGHRLSQRFPAHATWRARLARQQYGDDEQRRRSSSAAGPASVVAGRMMLKRVMGKASFATLQDWRGAHPALRHARRCRRDVHEAFKHWDLGDIVGVEGTLFKTKKGELTVHAKTAAPARQGAAAAAGEVPRPRRPGDALPPALRRPDHQRRRRGDVFVTRTAHHPGDPRRAASRAAISKSRRR